MDGRICHQTIFLERGTSKLYLTHDFAYQCLCHTLQEQLSILLSLSEFALILSCVRSFISLKQYQVLLLSQFCINYGNVCAHSRKHAQTNLPPPDPSQPVCEISHGRPCKKAPCNFQKSLGFNQDKSSFWFPFTPRFRTFIPSS